MNLSKKNLNYFLVALVSVFGLGAEQAALLEPSPNIAEQEWLALAYPGPREIPMQIDFVAQDQTANNYGYPWDALELRLELKALPPNISHLYLRFPPGFGVSNVLAVKGIALPLSLNGFSAPLWLLWHDQFSQAQLANLTGDESLWFPDQLPKPREYGYNNPDYIEQIARRTMDPGPMIPETMGRFTPKGLIISLDQLLEQPRPDGTEDLIVALGAMRFIYDLQYIDDTFPSFLQWRP